MKKTEIHTQNTVFPVEPTQKSNNRSAKKTEKKREKENFFPKLLQFVIGKTPN